MRVKSNSQQMTFSWDSNDWTSNGSGSGGSVSGGSTSSTAVCEKPRRHAAPENRIAPAKAPAALRKGRVDASPSRLLSSATAVQCVASPRPLVATTPDRIGTVKPISDVMFLVLEKYGISREEALAIAATL